MEKDDGAGAPREARAGSCPSSRTCSTYAGTHALLVVLQGRDASGKDGAIRKILEFTNIQQTLRARRSRSRPRKSARTTSSGACTRWCRARGHVALFNRSHYEDVLAARVHKHRPRVGLEGAATTTSTRSSGCVVDADVILLKFYLHISRDEQIRAPAAREKDPRTAWKLNPEDWREVPLWDEFTEAYEDALTRCATRDAPWYLVPADKKWFRNLAVMERIVLALRPYKRALARHAEGDGEEPDEGDPRPARADQEALAAGRVSPCEGRVISMTLSCSDCPRVISIIPMPAAVSACRTAICVLLLPPSPSSRK